MTGAVVKRITAVLSRKGLHIIIITTDAFPVSDDGDCLLAYYRVSHYRVWTFILWYIL
jgi:hypothetical protein